MAYRSKANEVHSFKRIADDIKEDRVEGLVVLKGVEDYLVDWSIDSIVSKYINPATKAMDFYHVNVEKDSLDTVIAACEAMPMFSQKKVVLVRGYKKEYGKDFVNYVSDVPPTTILILTGNDVDPEVIKKANIYDFGPLDQRQLVAFINKRFKAAGKLIDRALIGQIINKTGYNNPDVDYTLLNLEADLKKIIESSYGEQITMADIDDCISPSIEHGVFKLLDALSNNRKDEAFRLLHDILVSGEKELKLLANIVSQIELMLQVKELMISGLRLADIKNALKVHEFRVKKAMGFVTRYEVKTLKRILVVAYEADGNIKKGIIDPKLALQLVIAEI